MEEIEEDEDRLGKGLGFLECSVQRGHPLGTSGWGLRGYLRIVIDIVAMGQLDPGWLGRRGSLHLLVELAFGTAHHRNLRIDLRMTS